MNQGRNSKETDIVIKGANLHNLKNISVKIPKNKLIAISGVSGSGKSSLAFDTLFAEGQRRYIESLSSYARQFLGKLKKPDVEKIEGLSPTIAIEQKITIKNPRSTVGTTTEIYDYLKLLFSRIGKTYSPISGAQVNKHQPSDICDLILQQKNSNLIFILAEIDIEENVESTLLQIQKKGFSRILINGISKKIKNIIGEGPSFDNNTILLVIDRIFVSTEENLRNRISDSIQIAFDEGDGKCIINIDEKTHKFSSNFELDNIIFESPSPHLFSFNNPYGACQECEGFGSILGVDKDKVIINNDLSIYEGAVNCWSGKKLIKWKNRFILNSDKYDFPIHKPYKNLSKEMKDILWNGREKCKGIYDFFKKLEKKKYKIQNRVLISRYRGKTICPLCKGLRLKKEANYVRIKKKTISDITQMDIKSCFSFFRNLKLNKTEKLISQRLLTEIINRLNYLNKVGLGYLTLNRTSSTLSGGETQRINLATSLGSSLVGAIYILDEPSIGLHSRDTELLINVLKELRDIGNTVIIVEHDEEIIKNSDYIIDLGPKAGIHGGEIIFQGKLTDIYKQKDSLTKKYLTQELDIIRKRKRSWSDSIKLFGANQYNLKNLDIAFPLNCFVVVTGVSGSGKSTLIKEILKPNLTRILDSHSGSKKKESPKIIISTDQLKKIELIDQNPIGKSSRSNPVTYIKAYDDIRRLFAQQGLSKNRKYTPGFFSFNVDGGRCEKCNGDGEIVIEMQFMSDVYLECEICKGKRFKEEVLEVRFKNKTISDILDLSIQEAIIFFEINNQEKIAKRLSSLEKVGLGYIHLGQSSNTLSGGEAQRIKLASFLTKENSPEKTLFIFDEPTIGLHFHDINKLITSFNALIDKGHSIICIEHNMDVIKCGDWVIDLGPGGGERGGKIIFEGTPEELINSKKSITGEYLKKKMLTNFVDLGNLVE